MIQKFGIIVLLLLTFFMLAPRSSLGNPPSKPVTITKQAAWKQKMQSLYQSLAELLTDVCSDERYYDSKNSSRIEREIKKISTFSHELNKNTQDTSQADPTLQLFSGFLASAANEAYRSFRGGQKTYAREILRSIPSNCLACHSRNSSGSDFNLLPLEPKALLKPSEQAGFFAATRQFDRALESFQKVLRGKEKPIASAYDLDQSLREALLIAVRFKRDPALSKTLVQSLIENADAPQFLKENALSWKKSIEEWQSERSRKIETEEGMHAEALRLVAHARASQSYSLDHSADILYLRASSILYDLVQLAPRGKHVSEALLLLGMSYEVLNPRRMENLHNIYYEACIQHSPHTEIARTCYRRYEQSMHFGFTGSSGTHLPLDIKQKLLELLILAMPLKEVM